MTRKEFDDKMLELRERLKGVALEVCSMVLDATEGAISDDKDLIAKVLENRKKVDEENESIMLYAFETIVLQAPVSKDARFLASILAISGELRQAGVDAAKLAKRTKKIAGVFPPEHQAALGALSESVVQMLTETIRLFDVYDEELASNIIEYDSMIDSAYKKARNQIFVMASENPVATQELFWTIEIFHSLEHVADHAVEIARRMKQLN